MPSSRRGRQAASGSVTSEFVDARAPLQTESGSVGIEGQVIKIRIVTDEWLPSPHRCYKYKYEVIDMDSPYFQRVDQIHSEFMLSAGHAYVVRFNTNPRHPWIEGLIEEIAESR